MDQPPPIPDANPPQGSGSNSNPNPDSPAPPQMSLLAKLLNIFAIPGAVLDDVRASALSIGNWLLPILIATAVSAATFSATLAQPEVLEKFREQQKTRFAELVTSGKIQQSDADQNARTIDWVTQPEVAKVFFGFAAVFVSCVRVFWWAFALWFLGKVFLKTQFSFLKAAEVAGLASMITILGGVVVTLLTFGSSSDSGVEAVTSPGGADRRPVVLVVAGLFSIWFVTLLASGLAKLAGVHLSRTLMLMMGVWLGSQMVLALLVAALSGLGG